LTGYPVGLLLDKQRGDTHGAATRGDLKIKNVFFAGMGILGADDNNTNNQWTGDFSANYFNQSELNNQSFVSIDDLMLNEFKSKALPLSTTGFAANNPNANWGPKAGSPLRATGAADFTDPLVNDPFFTKVNYAGAFASDSEADNWLRGWTNFDPQNTDY